MSRTSFWGENALHSFLNPSLSYVTPLVEIPRSLNPLYEHGVRIACKMYSHSPLFTVKSLPAYHMLEKQSETDALTGHVLIESSSGNTVASLGILGGSLYGTHKTYAYASAETSPGKIQRLRFLGITPRFFPDAICPDPSDPSSAINQAIHDGSHDGYFNPGQYTNAANPAIHQTITGPQIWSQSDGRVSVFASSLGTTGTMIGTTSFLKQKNPLLHTLGIVRKPNNPIPGPRTRNLLREIAFDRKKHADDMISVSTKESYAQSLALCRCGLLVGPSTGANLSGIIERGKTRTADQRDRIRDDQGEIRIVTIACDTPFLYLNEYEKYCDSSLFPVAENSHLLPKKESSFSDEIQSVPTLSCHELFHRLHIQKIFVYDSRTPKLFASHHIPGATRTKPTPQEETIVVVCEYGEESVVVAQQLILTGYRNVFSLSGGMVEWSAQGFDRQLHPGCLVS